MLGFGVVNLPNNFDFNEEDMTAKEISVSQKFPFPGKRGLSEEVAAKEADAGAAEADDIANQVVKEVKTAFYDLSHVYRAMEVTQRNKSLLEELAKITQTRYSLGQGIQEDVIRNQVEISKMVDDLIMLEQKKRALAARLNYLLNRPPNSPLGRPAEVDFRPVAFSIEDLQQQAVDGQPHAQGPEAGHRRPRQERRIGEAGLLPGLQPEVRLRSAGRPPGHVHRHDRNEPAHFLSSPSRSARWRRPTRMSAPPRPNTTAPKTKFFT